MSIYHTQVKCKCMKCGLHFIICTFEPKQHTAGTIHCPECGQRGRGIMIWAEKVCAPIFKVVPGAAPLVGLFKSAAGTVSPNNN